jgi:hypothetical protein
LHMPHLESSAERMEFETKTVQFESPEIRTSFLVAALAAAAAKADQCRGCDKDYATNCHQNDSHLHRDCTEPTS